MAVGRDRYRLICRLELVKWIGGATQGDMMRAQAHASKGDAAERLSQFYGPRVVIGNLQTALGERGQTIPNITANPSMPYSTRSALRVQSE